MRINFELQWGSHDGPFSGLRRISAGYIFKFKVTPLEGHLMA
ncbi:hypothetical protein [Neobacillus drentensis]